MSPSQPEATVTAAAVVATTPQPDDAGAETADRFEWQAAMATAHALSMYYDWLIDNAVDSCVVCEMHEDWLLIKGTGAELVSARHRELSYGAYTTFTMLVDDGGIGHLFRRWHALLEKPTCRLVTTPALKAGEMQDVPKAAAWLKARQLTGESLARGPYEHIVTKLSASLPPDKELKPEIPAGGADGEFRLARVRRFLAGLTLQVEQPNRAYLQYAAPSMYAQAVVDQLGINISAEALWEAVLRLFRLRMRAAGPTPTLALQPLLQVLDGGVPAAADRDWLARTVSVVDIDVAVRSVIANPRGYLPLPRLSRTTRVAIKMQVGNCSSNSIERAEELRLSYQNYWRERKSGNPRATAAERRLRLTLLGIADQATDAVADDHVPWGRKLWTELQARLDVLPAVAGSPDLDTDLLLGGICALANECKIWFSEDFDVDAFRRQQEEPPA